MDSSSSDYCTAFFLRGIKLVILFAESTAWDAIADLCCILKLHTFLQKSYNAADDKATAVAGSGRGSSSEGDPRPHDHKVSAIQTRVFPL